MSFLERKLPLTMVSPHRTLCDLSERRLTTAIADNGIIIVNDVFLLKFFGVMAAVALTNRRVNNGLIHNGYWYYPSTEDTKSIIKDAFIQGATEVDIAGSTWCRSRRLKGFTKDNEQITRRGILFLAQSAARELHETTRTTSQRQRKAYLSNIEP